MHATITYQFLQKGIPAYPDWSLTRQVAIPYLETGRVATARPQHGTFQMKKFASLVLTVALPVAAQAAVLPAGGSFIDTPNTGATTAAIFEWFDNTAAGTVGSLYGSSGQQTLPDLGGIYSTGPYKYISATTGTSNYTSNYIGTGANGATIVQKTLNSDTIVYPDPAGRNQIAVRVGDSYFSCTGGIACSGYKVDFGNNAQKYFSFEYLFEGAGSFVMAVNYKNLAGGQDVVYQNVADLGITNGEHGRFSINPGVDSIASVEFQVIGANSFLYIDNLAAGLTAPVPEPATWAMMIAGFGLVGASIRRRSKTARVQFG